MGRVRCRAEEVYEDGYFARKVIGVGRLVAAWRWADKIQCATDEESPPPEEAHSKSSNEDTYAPPDEVAPDPPTLDWFWGQYDLSLCKSLLPAEKARQVAFEKQMAEKLSLTTRPHPNPYYIQWFNNSGKVKVTRTVRVHFSISTYVDCDVVPMQACSLLLGRPWQLDKNFVDHGRNNQYTHVIRINILLCFLCLLIPF